MQATYGVQNLRWEQFQAGPQHTAPWTAIAYSTRVHGPLALNNTDHSPSS